MLCVIHQYVPIVRFRRRDTFSVFRIITGSGKILIGGYLSYTVKYGTPYPANVKTTDLWTHEFCFSSINIFWLTWQEHSSSSMCKAESMDLSLKERIYRPEFSVFPIITAPASGICSCLCGLHYTIYTLIADIQFLEVLVLVLRRSCMVLLRGACSWRSFFFIMETWVPALTW